MTAHLYHYLTLHGWHVWREWHPYYADWSRGGWWEWLCAR